MKARTFGLLSLMLAVAMVMPCEAWVTLDEMQAAGAASALLSQGAACTDRVDDTGKNVEVHVRQRIERSACVDFEDLPLPPMGVYHVGDTFPTGPAIVTALPFQWSGGGWTSDGYAQVDTSGLAGGSGQEMMVNNVNLHFHFAAPLSCLELKFGEYGGNLNIEINGDFRNFENFADINGLIIGGVEVSVVNGLGNDQGTLTLNGTIHSFVLGGQELWIDDVCPCRFFVYLPLVVRHAAGAMDR
jgi:hypothetical protein